MKKGVFALLRTFMLTAFVSVLSFGFVSCDPDSGGGTGDNGDGTGDSPTINYATEEGLYVGIIGFNNNIVSKDISILNSSTKYNYTNFVDNLGSANGTALYYAVDMAIDKFGKATMPEELENVSIVTFTDGLDNFSTVMPGVEDFNYTKKEYLSEVNEKLTTTTVRDKSLTAYSIGIQGNDVQDENEFENNLESLSTSEENIYRVDNMDDVNSAFEQIAKSLNTKSVSRSITLKISGGIDNGSRIKFTLDDVSEASSSRFYIEGDIYRKEKKFSNVTCEGISVDNENIGVNMVDGFIVLSFNIVDADYEIDASDIKYWTKNSKDEWQKDSEFDPKSQAETSIIRKSAAIMLVLDCSSSLGEDFEQLKTAAKEFINILVSGESDEGNSSFGDGYSDGRLADLGLSVKWASCNVGAESPEEYGDYFAWGETTTKSSYDSSNSVTDALSTSELQSRGIVGSDGQLTAEYDAATVNWGSPWRMPTLSEMQELIYECTWIWSTLNGVYGFKVIGPNGNSIFLPAAGYRYLSSLFDAGYHGGYWSSTPYSTDYTCYLSIYSGGYDCYADNRIYGYAVRPVSE